MLTILYGTQGARREIYRRIGDDVQAARRAYLIVPDQKALLAESALMKNLPPSAALLVDAVGFSRLSNLVCRKYGGLCGDYANDGAKILFLYRAVKKLSPMLSVFDTRLGCRALGALVSLFTEFRAYAVTPEQLGEASRSLSPSPLADKLSDLALLYAEYESSLHKRYVEAADDLDRLADLLAKHDFFENAKVYIDSFVSFTGQEMKIIGRMLAKNTDVTVTLPLSGTRSAHTAETTDTRRRLLRLAAKFSVLTDEIETEDEDTPAALDFAKRNLWNFSCTERFLENTRGTIELVRCADKSEEAELCLREIYQIVSSGGAYADIAIIARNAADYEGILDPLLTRCEIPFFFSKKTDASLLPLTKLTLAALSLYVYDFRTADVISYIKTGLCGLSDEECDLFEEYVGRWNINGRRRYLDGEDFTMSPEGYTAAEMPPDALAGVNEVKRKFAAPLLRLCDSLSAAHTGRDFAEAVFFYLCDAGIRERAADPAFTRFFGVDKTAESVRLWNILLDALDVFTAAAGDEEITAAEFCDLLRLLFSALDVGHIPSSRDQIIVGSADTIRIDRRPYILILGANEGVFPAPVAESPALGEEDRRTLETLGVKLSQNRALRSARELYHFVRALDCAQKRAVISYYTQAPDGAPAEKSFAAERLEKIFGGNLYTYAFSSLPPLERLCYAQAARMWAGRFDAKTERLLQTVLTLFDLYTPPLANAKAIQNSDASLSPSAARAALGDTLRLSQSRLDCYSDCRLRWFLQYMLSLRDTAPFEFRPVETGNFVHGVLERFMIELKQSGRFVGALTSAEIEEAAARLCAAETEKIMRSCGGGSARMLFFFDRLRKNLRLILTSLNAEFSQTAFRPVLFEYKIGLAGGHAPLKFSLPDGGGAEIRGVADRVDVCRTDAGVLVRVADYKTGDKIFREEDLLHGKNLQLPIYLFTLCKVGDEDFRRRIGALPSDRLIPAGAAYFVVKPPRIRLDAPPERDMYPDAVRALRREGILLAGDAMTKDADSSANRPFSAKLLEKNEREMDELFNTVKASVSRIACDMRDGRIDCAETQGGAKSPCLYCPYTALCRGEKSKGGDQND